MARKKCPICKRNIEVIDYRDTVTLVHYMTPWSKMKGMSDTGTCAKHQRRMAEAIKRARFMALLPYVTR
jgi:small subunit ribosomal protein S18